MKNYFYFFVLLFILCLSVIHKSNNSYLEMIECILLFLEFYDMLWLRILACSFEVLLLDATVRDSECCHSL